MPKLYLVRHGEPISQWDEHPDPELSPLGQRQAREVAEKLISYEATDCVSSPMARALQTAQPYGQIAQQQVTVSHAIRELPSYWIPRSQRRKWLEQILAANWDDAEPEIDVWRQSLISWATELKNDTVAFAHFVVINALIAAATGSSRVLNALPDHCAIATFSIDDNGIQFLGIDRELKTDIKL